MISIKKRPDTEIKRQPAEICNGPGLYYRPSYIQHGQGRRREDARKKLMKDHNIPLDRAVPHKKLPRQAAEQLGSLLKA